MKLGESIFSALVESSRFFAVEVLDTNYWRHGYRFRFVVVRMVWKRSCCGGRVTKRQMFFCVWRCRQVFCEFPLEWSFEIVIGGRYFETVFWMWLRDAQNFDRTKSGEDSQIRKYFGLGNVGRIYKSLGCLEKNPGIFCAKKKKKEEECS